MRQTTIIFFLSFLFFISCNDDDEPGPTTMPGVDLTGITYDPTPVSIPDIEGLPAMDIPGDNPQTQEGIDLGRMLFFDPILSVDSTISCASCHDPVKGFADGTAVSTGVNGLTGDRSSMSLLNIGFATKGLFWDGRAAHLEDQALGPVENPLEMADTWENVETKLRLHVAYPTEFRKAFGIKNSNDITREHVTKAIAQFERTIIVHNSRFDKKFYQLDTDPFLLTDLEVDGRNIYFDEPGYTDAHCSHCHDGQAKLTTDDYFNNGLDSVATLNDFVDLGLGGITGKLNDNGKFRAPSLRNIALTAPYMHDGRFWTLEEVVEHYNSGVHLADNVKVESTIPASYGGLGLSDYEKQALVAFLHTFTDTTYYSNPDFKNPFE